MIRRLILASGSPRRRAFFAALGLDFTIEAADLDETPIPGETPDAMVLRLSRDKAQTVAARHSGEAVLAADTVVVLDGVMLGKPVDPAEAAGMLTALRGRMHRVYTAVSVACPSSGGTCRPGDLASRVCESRVWMRNYGDAELASYVATGDPLDKAGAYAIQHPSFSPVERWEGCYASIMGLPLGLAAALLRDAGIPVRDGLAGICESVSGARSCCLRGRDGDGCHEDLARSNHA